MKRRLPAQTLPPGNYVKEELEYRGWTQGDLAEVLGRPTRLVNEIIAGKRAITAETAQGLAIAFGTDAQLWMNFESQYQLSKIALKENAIQRKAKIYGRFPVREMQKRGWLGRVASLDETEAEIKRYFGIASIDDEIEIAHAAKKTSYDRISREQIAWLVRAQQLAANLEVSKYSADRLPQLFAELRACVLIPSDAAKVPQILAKYGIRLVIVAPLPGSKIDAACTWFRGQPLVALTLRYDKHDIFWHALLHELDHIEHGEGKTEAIVDSNLLNDCSHGQASEKRANKHAANKLIPSNELEAFIARVQPFFSDASIVDFAKRMNVHPGIVVGQLQHHGLIPWSTFAGYKVRIRELITPSAKSDGF
jgi:HTH-type transcriptional regulator / antitoxin HigA